MNLAATQEGGHSACSIARLNTLLFCNNKVQVDGGPWSTIKKSSVTEVNQELYNGHGDVRSKSSDDTEKSEIISAGLDWALFVLVLWNTSDEH